MRPRSAHELAALVDARLQGAPEARALRVIIDTRAGLRAGDLFVALRGPHFDGADFAPRAWEEGASVVLAAAASADALTPHCPAGAALLLVDDPMAALRTLAGAERAAFRGPVLAITGSNGKTVVKDMVRAAAGHVLDLSLSPLSWNSQVGVPLALLEARADADAWVIECGVSQPGEMEAHRALVRPTAGIFTNVGTAHLDGLGSAEGIAAEKARLFAQNPPIPVLVPADEPLARAALEAVGARVVAVRWAGATGAVAGATGAGAGASQAGAGATQAGAGATGAGAGATGAGAGATQAESGATQAGAGAGASPRLAPDDAGMGAVPPPLRLPAVAGAPFVTTNAALAARAALLLGAAPEQVEAGLAGWVPAAMRLQISTTSRGVLLINDAYAADPLSVAGALDVLAAERGGGRAIAVLGAMAQLGAASAEAHARLGRHAVRRGVDELIVVGEGARPLAEAAVAAGMAAERVRLVHSVEEAAALLEVLAPCAGDRVLLKASRPERLERLAALFFDTLSPTRLHVDLDAVRENVAAVRRRLAPGCEVLAVLKATGYGVDALRLARSLERAGVRAFGVAYPDEGELLRERGVTSPILVQNVLAEEMEKVVRSGLSAQVASASQVAALAAEAQRQRRVTRAHLKVDTGMGRSGVDAPEAVALAQRIATDPWLQLEGLMTHFAAAEDPAQDTDTRVQIARFAAVREALEAAGIVPRWVHACNTSGIARFPEAHGTLVRLGIGLFGIGDAEGEERLGLQPVLRLVTRVLALRDLPEGASVGYGRTWRAGAGGARVAVVAIGYADGYPWSLGNAGWMRVRDTAAPVVGRVCMDVTMLDVSACPEVAVGDEVVVYGGAPGEPRIEALAERAGTIPYELLTRISPRVRRIFDASL